MRDESLNESFSCVEGQEGLYRRPVVLCRRNLDAYPSFGCEELEQESS